MSKEKIQLCDDLSDIMPPEYLDLVSAATFGNAVVPITYPIGEGPSFTGVVNTLNPPADVPADIAEQVAEVARPSARASSRATRSS